MISAVSTYGGDRDAEVHVRTAVHAHHQDRYRRRISSVFCDDATCASFGDTGQYEQLGGRAPGELDPRDSSNRIIQDIDLGKDTDGKVHYVATHVKSFELPSNAPKFNSLKTNSADKTNFLSVFWDH